MSKLVLTTLGGVSLTLEPAEDTTTPPFAAGKPAALLTYLTLSPGRAASREHLVDLLWSDRELDSGRHALRLVCTRLRQAFGTHVELNGRDTLALKSAIASDRDDFLKAAQARDFESAVRLYTGDFFPGFASPGAAEFERWADLERERLRGTFARCADSLVRRWLDTGRHRDATALARRVRDAAPLSQPGWRLLLEALVASREPELAAIEADALAHLLEREEIPHEPATTPLLKMARQLSREPLAATDSQKGLVADLIGREREFSTIMSAWEGARAGRSSHVHLTAPAGMGKTRLLTDVRARLVATRARVVSVRGSLGARDLPFALASDLAAALARLPGAQGIAPGSASALVALNPALSSSFSAAADRSEGDEAVRRRGTAVRDQIVVAADEEPIALLIDDAQWIDAASRRLLGSVLGGLDGRRVLVLSAGRSHPNGQLEGSGQTDLALEPLSAADVSALVASVCAMPNEAWASALSDVLRQATGGSPLLILESLQLALERGLLVRSPDGWSTSKPDELFDMLRNGGALRLRVAAANTEERKLLLMLAVAGAPMGLADLSHAAVCEPGDIDRDLSSLERRGIIRRESAGWQLAHDEYSEIVLEQALPGDVRATHAAIGAVLFEHAGADVRRLRSAAAHLVRAGEIPMLQRLYARYVLLSRRSEDHRSNRTLAKEMLGEGASVTDVRAMAASLPLRVRTGLISPRRIAATAIGALLVPVGMTLLIGSMRQPPPPLPDAVLVVAHTDTTGQMRLYDFPLDYSRWTPGKTLALDLRGNPRWQLRHGNARTVIYDKLEHGYPDGDWWVGSRSVPDSGILDIFAFGPGGQQRRLTHAPGDDVLPSWAPDGSALTFATGRFHPLQRRDIAVLDPKTLTVRQLTRGDESDDQPLWSPDGTRIAFHRKNWDGKPGDLCNVTVDGARLKCVRIDFRFDLLAWIDDQQVLLTQGDAEKMQFARLNVETGSVRWLDSARVRGSPIVSPDGRWIACLCASGNEADYHWSVFPVDRPEHARRVTIGALPAEDWSLLWARPPRPTRHLDRLTISVGEGQPIFGAPHQLRAVGHDSAGGPVRIAAITWRSLDTSAAIIDSTGRLTPRRLGRVTVEASAGGWRSTSATLTVREVRPRIVNSEDWQGPLNASWVPFGEPRPMIVRAADGTRSLWSNGDGSYTSGAYSKRIFSVSDGLALDAVISTPVTLQQWQQQHLGFRFIPGSRWLDDWDHRTGYMPIPSRQPGCTMIYPGGPEGPNYAKSISGFGLGSITASDELGAGDWIAVRIQVFPDGRCGLAINGQPISIGRRQETSGTKARVVLDGMSYHTRMLVGPLTVRTGVPADIDWSQLQGPARVGAVEERVATLDPRPNANQSP